MQNHHHVADFKVYKWKSKNWTSCQRKGYIPTVPVLSVLLLSPSSCRRHGPPTNQVLGDSRTQRQNLDRSIQCHQSVSPKKTSCLKSIHTLFLHNSSLIPHLLTFLQTFVSLLTIPVWVKLSDCAATFALPYIRR